MDSKLSYHVYFHCELATKEEVHAFISEMVSPNDASQQDKIVQRLNKREQAGSTLIAEHVMLPHIESSQIKQSQIIFIRLADPILSWDDQAQDIRLLIVILLKKNESEQTKKHISLFTRTLADEEYLNGLLEAQEKETFEQKIIKI